MDINTLRKALETQKYIFDEELLISLYVALLLGKPVLVEGAPGTGKTEIAKVLSAGLGYGLIRLQCYEGLDDSKALYEWNYQKQLLSIQLDSLWIRNAALNKFKEIKKTGLNCSDDPAAVSLAADDSAAANSVTDDSYKDNSVTYDSGSNDVDKNSLITDNYGIEGYIHGKSGQDRMNRLYTREFLLERPLLKAISTESQSVLLIDEIDKTDEEFEAFLLELLSDFQISVPELGTIVAKTKPVVILTSNNTRELSDALRRRCVYVYLDYPGKDKELAIVKARLPGIDEKLAEEAIGIITVLRDYEQIQKKPSISETLDWLSALTAIGRKRLDENGFESTKGFLLKNREDLKAVEKLGGYNGLLSKKSG